MQTEQNTPNAASVKGAYEWLSSLIAALIVVAIVFCFLFRVVTVDGESMTNTLQHGDSLIMISRFYQLEHGDVVVIDHNEGEPLIKRIIGLPGDVINVDDEGRVYRNGAALDEPYTRDGITPTMGASFPYTVPDGYIFAMGDNRVESLDSRMLGAFLITDVLGETVYRISPFDRVGRFN